MVQNEKGITITNIRSDYGGKFENHVFETFYEENGISHEFSAPRTPQQHELVEGIIGLYMKWLELC